MTPDQETFILAALSGSKSDIGGIRAFGCPLAEIDSPEVLRLLVAHVGANVERERKMHANTMKMFEISCQARR